MASDRKRIRPFKLKVCKGCQKEALMRASHCRKCMQEMSVAWQKRPSKIRQCCSGCNIWFYPTNRAAYTHRRRELADINVIHKWYCSLDCMWQSKTLPDEVIRQHHKEQKAKYRAAHLEETRRIQRESKRRSRAKQKLQRGA